MKYLRLIILLLVLSPGLFILGSEARRAFAGLSGTTQRTLFNLRLCTASATGVLTCPGFTGTDRTCASNTDCNSISVYDNDGGADTTCAVQGVPGRLKTIDKDGSASDVWVACAGTTEVLNFSLGGPTTTTTTTTTL
jgi:hypothetical protein